jgi:OmcA/MtrC family decaheme c-type cytochrome
MKFGTARGTTRTRVSLLALMATAAVGVAACGGSGRSGSGGTVGPPGPTGPTGTGSAIAISQADTVIVTINVASVDKTTMKPTVTFSLTNSEGKPLDGLQAANVRFTFAKVIPGVNGVPSEWRSYISRVNSPDPAANPVPPATPAADQKPTEYATFETAVATVGGVPCTSTGGVFKAFGGGQYQYTFSKGLTEYSGVSYDPLQTQRVGMQVRGDAACAPGANTDKLLELTPQALVTNGVYDFVPGGGLPVSPDIIDPAQCNACHVRLSAHGGGRTDFAFCVTCHNPYTVQSATDTPFDMMYMAHQIHMGGNLAIPFPIWVPASGSTPGFMDYPFADVTYPQDIRNCLTCHNDSTSGSKWKTAVTIANCTSCHESATFTGPNPTHGGGPASEDQCTNCHVQSNLPQLSVNGAHAMSTDAPLLPSTPSVREYGNRFKFEIVSLDAVSFTPGAFPKFTFRITDPTNGNAPYNIVTSPYFSGSVCTNGTARLAFDIGWSAADINNAGSGSGPGQPISLNPIAGCSTTTTAAGVVANADGSYTMTSSVAIPATVTGTAVVGFEGHPAGDLDGNGVYSDRIPVKNVFRIAAVTGATPSPRRTVVNVARCDACHKVLSLHGNNRTDEPQVCVICHNPSATDISRRTGATMVASASCPQGLVSTVDGRCEQTIDFKRMIHMIHASALQQSGSPFVVYGFGGSVNDFAEVTYPPGEKISQCETCHEPDTYYPVDPNLVQATTTSTGASITSQTDDTGITPNTSVCSGCHTGSTAALHMTQNGGSFNAPKPAGGIVTSPFETCGVCHGPGKVADVKLMHKVGIYKSGGASN